MSKKLLYLLTLICSISLFTACSDDDNEKKEEEVDNSWEQVVGDYSGEKLTFSYGETTLTGKEVKFSATNGTNGSLLLKNVIPGENETTISDIAVTKGEFSGTATTTNANVEYTGSVKDEVMTLKLTVVMNDPNGWAKTYRLSNYETGEYNYEGMPMIVPTNCALYANWEAEENYVNVLVPIFKIAGGILLPQVLNTVTLETDGNITAEFMQKQKVQFEQSWIMSFFFTGNAPDESTVKALIPASGWQTAPKHLAYWFVKNDQLYVKLNISTILSQVLGSEAEGLGDIINELLNGDPSVIKGMLSTMAGIDLSNISDASFATLLSWVKDGIPMNVKIENGCTYMYLDKKSFDPFFSSHDVSGEATSDLSEIWKALVAAGKIPQEMQPMALFINMITEYWPGTTAFGLGMNLQAAN